MSPLKRTSASRAGVWQFVRGRMQLGCCASGEFQVKSLLHFLWRSSLGLGFRADGFRVEGLPEAPPKVRRHCCQLFLILCCMLTIETCVLPTLGPGRV